MTRLLCTAHGCPSCWQEGYTAAMRNIRPRLSDPPPDVLRLVLADDRYPAAFQTPGDYRAALLRYLDRGEM